ncbi:MAG: hypothetical protein FWD86_00635 [Firmicutes bacterium]|nr:hypothetical protein [Bacillota bacterium]
MPSSTASAEVYSNAKSNLKFWGCPAKDKAIFLFEKYTELLLTNPYNHPNYPDKTKIHKRISDFFANRNKITHDWEANASTPDNTYIVPLLETIIYLSILERAGFEPKDVVNSAKNMFAMHLN